MCPVGLECGRWHFGVHHHIVDNDEAAAWLEQSTGCGEESFRLVGLGHRLDAEGYAARRQQRVCLVEVASLDLDAVTGL
jgi:hypothetical protein